MDRELGVGKVTGAFLGPLAPAMDLSKQCIYLRADFRLATSRREIETCMSLLVYC